MKKNIFNIVLFFLCSSLNAQIQNVSVGGAVNMGSIKGNSPNIPAVGGSVFIDFYPWFEKDVSIRSSFTYAQTAEGIVPEDRMGRYYSFIKLFSLKGFIRQNFSGHVYIEAGAGLIYTNDRTYSDTNIWEPGAGFTAAVCYDFRDENKPGISISTGFDYGISFTQTEVSYTMFYIQAHYHF